MQTPLVLKQLPSIVTHVPGSTGSLLPIGCDSANTYCITTTVSAAAMAGLLRDFKFRFLDSGIAVTKVEFYKNDFWGNLILDAGITASIVSITYTSIDGTKHVQWKVTPTTALPPNEQIQVTYSYPGAPHNPCGLGTGFTCNTIYDYTPPFSTAFDFVNGTTSTAGYDLGTATLSSDNAVSFSFDPTTPGLVPGPSILPTDSPPGSAGCPGVGSPYGCWEETDDHAQPISVFEATPPSQYADAFVTQSVLEPPVGWILAVALAGFASLRIRTGRSIG